MFSSEQMAAILASLPDPAFILTRSGRYAAIFGGADARYYHDGANLVGHSLHDVLAPDKAGWFLREIGKALESHSLHVVEYSLAGCDVKGLEQDGPDFLLWFEGRVQALDFPVQGEDAVLWVASNITARYNLEAMLRQQSETDELTGLYNRRKLMETLASQYDLFARYGTPLSLLIFDIDHFKGINDKYGHMSGDRALSVAADVCRAELRGTDFPARLGGDEFVVLMPHTVWDGALPIAERLRVRIAQALADLGTLGGGATISGGLSSLRPGDSSGADVLKRADDALYQAKRSGRNRIEAAAVQPDAAFPATRTA